MLQTSPRDRRTILVDATGGFAFRDLAAGAHALQADPGMHSARYVGTGAGGPIGASSKPIVLDDGQRVEDARIGLPRAGAVEGRVVDEFGEPVAPADRMMPWGSPTGGMVDAEMQFTIGELLGPAVIRPQQMPQDTRSNGCA